MTQKREGHISRAISSVLPPERIRELAVEVGAVKRQRKVDMPEFVYSLVLGFATGGSRTLSGLRRAFQLATGKTLARSSFHGRFNAELVSLFQKLTLEALKTLSASRPKLKKAFAPFLEVLAIDSSVIRLHAGLKEKYPSTWINHTPAAMKLTMVANVVGRGPKSFRLAPGSRHDVHLLKPGKWLRGRLLLFDLGFYRGELFREIDRSGGDFLSRLRKQVNPLIVSSHRKEHENFEGQLLSELEAECQEELIDIQGQSPYALKRQKHQRVKAEFRIICVYNYQSQCWHRYLTNVPQHMLRADSVTAVYAARWEIELLFRELKSSYRIDEMPSRNLHASEALLHASLLTFIVSRKLYRLVSRTHARGQDLPGDRWGRLLTSVATEILRLVLAAQPDHTYENRLLVFLQKEAPDPNRSRELLPTRAQNGVVAFA